MEHGESGDRRDEPVVEANGHLCPDRNGVGAGGRLGNGVGPPPKAGGNVTRRPEARRTADEQLLESTALDEPSPWSPERGEFKHTEAWRVLRIQGEFVYGINALAEVGAAVSVFGSARFGGAHPMYEAARRLGGLLTHAGFAVITGGGPGIMEAANRGAFEAGGLSIGCNIELPFE